MHHPARTIVLFLALSIASPVMAQLGPLPSQLAAPTNDTQAQPVDQSAESDSARIRPALDEMLMARARSGTDPLASTADEIAVSVRLREELRAEEQTLASSTAPSQLQGTDDSLSGTSTLPTLGDGWGQTIVALGGVLLLIFGVAQVFKRLARSQGGLAGQLGAGGNAPSGILEVIGRYPITTGLTLVVLKFDRRVLLVSSSSGTRGKNAKGPSMQTLCELTDPEDVASILLKSRSASGESIAHSFERALQDADDFTDESIYRYDEPMKSPARTPTRSRPARTITSDEGDRAELWSSSDDGLAAAKVLRQRLSSMRSGNRSA